MVRHFWKRWSSEYIDILSRFNKWHFPSRNLRVNDVVIMQENNLVSTRWPMGCVVKGNGSLVRVVDIKTNQGVYERPVIKILPNENWTLLLICLFVIILSFLVNSKTIRSWPAVCCRLLYQCHTLFAHFKFIYVIRIIRVEKELNGVVKFSLLR